jgi:hypothetical protein
VEIFILIPIIAVIYGWMQSFPSHPAPVEDVNGLPFGNGFCDDYVPNSETLFADDDTFSTSMNFDDDIHLSSGISLNYDGYGFDQPDIIHELMFNPINSWSEISIYHHDDHIFDDSMNTMNDPFSCGISDSFSTGIGEL